MSLDSARKHPDGCLLLDVGVRDGDPYVRTAGSRAFPMEVPHDSSSQSWLPEKTSGASGKIHLGILHLTIPPRLADLGTAM